MMTSRAEYRLLLRQDNADIRLCELGREIGLVDQKRYDRFMYKKEMVESLKSKLENTPAKAAICITLTGTGPNGPQTLADILRRPGIHAKEVLNAMGERELPDDEILDSVETEIKYEGYIEKQKHQVEQFRSLENRKLPLDFDYTKIQGLRIEAQQKLQSVKPEKYGQAARISGVSPRIFLCY